MRRAHRLMAPFHLWSPRCPCGAFFSMGALRARGGNFVSRSTGHPLPVTLYPSTDNRRPTTDNRQPTSINTRPRSSLFGPEERPSNISCGNSLVFRDITAAWDDDVSSGEEAK